VPAVAELAVAHLTEPIGHEMPGMHGVYGHASPAMRADLKAALQERWEDSTRERARLREWSAAPRSGLEPRTCKNPGGSRDRTRTYNLPVNRRSVITWERRPLWSFPARCTCIKACQGLTRTS
jgi:hypothetical protein